METIEQYIARFEPPIQKRLRLLQALFREKVPEEAGSIHYHMPSYQVGSRRFYFAAYKRHIGFYPVYGLDSLEEKLAPFRAPGTRDTLHFGHKQPIPVQLIREILDLAAGS